MHMHMHLASDRHGLLGLERSLGIGARRLRRVGAVWLLLFVAAGYVILGFGTTTRNRARVRNVFDEMSCRIGGNVSQPIKRFMTEESILRRTADCDAYFDSLGWSSSSLSVTDDERSFPLAFSHALHHDVAIFETMLALWFRPGDAHCVHVDAKASDAVVAAVAAIVGCYKHRHPGSNFTVISIRSNLLWGHISVLDADLKCMRSLLPAPWRAFVTTAGSELPLAPIDHVRATLKQVNASVVDSFEVPAKNKFRHTHSYVLTRYNASEFAVSVRKTSHAKDPPPFNLTIRKGSKTVALSRNFVLFALNSSVALGLYNWLQDSWVADEHFYSTLATIPQAETNENVSIKNNTGVVQNLSRSPPTGVCVRESWWYSKNCKGKSINSVCNFALADLVNLSKSKCFIANKFNLKVDPMAVACQRNRIIMLTQRIRGIAETYKESDLP